MKKGIFVIGCLIGMLDFSFAQTAPGIEWAKCYGGSLLDAARAIFQTNDNGFVIAGKTFSNDSNVTGNHDTLGNSMDIWVIKIDSIGNLLSQKCFGGNDQEESYSIIATNDSGFIVAGNSATQNNGDVTGHHGSGANYDIWIVKLSDSLTIEWQKSLGGSYHELAPSLIQTSDQGYLISGYTRSNNGDVTNNHGQEDGWLVKLDSTGNIVWQKCIGGSNSDWFGSIFQTNDGGIILIGDSKSNDGDVGVNYGGRDYWVVKTDSLSNIIWEKSYGGSGNDIFRTACKTKNFGFIISGYSDSNDGDVNGGNHGGYDAWVVLIDSVGNIQWQKSFGGSTSDGLTSIIQASDSGYIFQGWTFSTDGDLSGLNIGVNDIWLSRIDSVGNFQWHKFIGGSNVEGGNKILLTNDGGIISIGGAYSNDGDVSGNNGSEDFWVVKLFPDTITGIIQHQNQTSNIQISPNPFTSTLTIKSTTQKGELIIFDVTGKEILRVKTFGAETKINTAHLTPGFYFINYREENRSVNKKVVKM